MMFLQVATKAFNPFVPSSGTEHMAPLLYSLVRMVRPMTVVEFGSGYTTLFVLRALADNACDIEEERKLLREKSSSLLPLPANFEDLDIEVAAGWFARGGKACGVDPSYYLKPYTPQLYSFEELPADHEYSRTMTQAVTDIGHTDLFTCIHSKFSAESAPQQVDLAWNDDHSYQEFFEVMFPRLNPNGGLFVFHNVPSDEGLWNSIEWMKNERSAQKDLEVMILQEPHKLNQNGCALIRRTTSYRPPSV
jgi:predicted O-methyltransferase YrrM